MQSARATEWRSRKDAVDRVKARYFRLLEPGSTITQYSELAGLAEELGRGFEARGWWFLASRFQSSTLATAAIDRLGPPRPDPRLPTGKTLASHLGDLANQVALQPKLSGTGPASALPSSGPPPAAAAAINAPEFRDDRPPRACDSSSITAGRRSASFPRPPRAASACSTTTATAGSTSTSFREVRSLLIQQGPPAGDRLFRNRGDGTFEDVTETSGIATMKRGYGHGVAVGDFDNDGQPDLFVTRWRSYALYRNRGDGTFEDVTDRAGFGGDRDWPTSAAFADLDNDGDLDLYVCHYLVWDAEHPTLCEHPTKAGEPIDPDQLYEYCMPNPFPQPARPPVPERRGPIRRRDGRGRHR